VFPESVRVLLPWGVLGEVIHVLLCYVGVGITLVVNKLVLLGLDLGQLGLDTLADLVFNIPLGCSLGLTKILI